MSDAAFPPPGFIDRDEAARMFGVAARTWADWEGAGKVDCGRWFKLPWGGDDAVSGGGGRADGAGIERGPIPPAGHGGPAWGAHVRHRRQDVVYLGARGPDHLRQVGLDPGKPGQQKIYPVEELRRQVEEFKKEPPFPPPGFVGRHEACRIFGVAIKTWTEWESRGRITCGRLVPNPGKPGRCKIYPADELRRIKEDLDRQAEEESRRLEPYPDPQRPGCWRVPVVSKVHQMEAIVDAESLPLVQGKRWNWSPGGNGLGTVVLATGGTPRPPLHQIVMGVRGIEHRVAHLNGDPLDCRRENLVVRTHSEQKAATRKVAVKAGAGGQLPVQGR